MAVMVLLGLGYSSLVTWACQTGGKWRLWIVTVAGILVIALVGRADWRGQRVRDTSLNDYYAVALIPAIVVSLLIAKLRRRNVRPTILIAIGSTLWVVVALIVLSLSLLFDLFNFPLQRIFG
jgi:hypothetical protein